MTQEEGAVPWYDLRRAQTRLQLSLLLGVLALLGLRTVLPLGVAAIGAWDCAASSLLASSWWIIAGGNAADARMRAGAEDPGRRVLLLLSLASSLASFFAAALLLQQLGDDAALRGLAVGLCLASPLLAWLLTHSVYTLHYAHLYYGASGAGQGLSFPGEGDPDDLDFAYFAFTIGMTFQTSDVEVTSKRLRRSVLLHALLSFVFNTGVIALALNLVLGKLI
ncbi:MAG TPA: DUF1345 domain-containing protein [Polyangiales bacterium]|nr:DUF1345 domain-containing protein [Polyangiales bacterium]